MFLKIPAISLWLLFCDYSKKKKQKLTTDLNFDVLVQLYVNNLDLEIFAIARRLLLNLQSFLFPWNVYELFALKMYPISNQMFKKRNLIKINKFFT
jgi:hypothetical protein